MPPMHHADQTAAPTFDQPTISPSRRSLLKGAAALAPMIAVGAGAATSASALDGFHDAAGLHRIGEWPHPDIRSVDFRFDTGGKVKTFPPSVRVTVPPSYDQNPDRRYPVLLLLHGGGGFFLDWSNSGNVIAETAKHEVIVVMPDGGAGSFYSNANFPWAGREAAWETFIMDQVLPFVHSNFRTQPDRMAIAGLSMGGWGALALGQRYWGHFRSVSSYSGPADCNPATESGLAVAGIIWAAPIADAVKYFGTTNVPGATWGHALYPEIAKGYNPMENIETYRNKRIFLRSGNGTGMPDLLGNQDVLGAVQDKIGNIVSDVQEVVVHDTQQRFSQALGEAGIDHDFEVRQGATHEWGLWRDSLAEDLPGMMKVLNA